MTILWQKNLNGTRYEVRTAGKTHRLYTNGVFHSQFHPDRATTGGIWDLLMLPAFFLAPHKIQRVLVLGVGGGAVIRQLHRYVQPERIIGVELNPVHLEVARRFFGVDDKIAELHQAEAVEWLEQYDGPPFDMIIEDLFGEQDGEPVRAVKADINWCNALSRHLSRDGVLVMNFIDIPEMRQSECLNKQHLAKRFKSAFQFTLPLYENVIVALLKTEADSRTLHKHLRKTVELDAAQKSSAMNFRVRRMPR
jgi:spermidine synthase